MIAYVMSDGGRLSSQALGGSVRSLERASEAAVQTFESIDDNLFEDKLATSPGGLFIFCNHCSNISKTSHPMIS